MSTTLPISRASFGQGLFLAACAEGAPRSFLTEGRAFHAVWDGVFSFMRGHRLIVPGLELVKRDPVFGVYHEVGELLLEALEGRILAFDGISMSRMRFVVTRSAARAELAGLEGADAIRDTGRVLAAGLSVAERVASVRMHMRKGTR